MNTIAALALFMSGPAHAAQDTLGPFVLTTELDPSNSSYCLIDPDLQVVDVSHITFGSGPYALPLTKITIENVNVVSCVEDAFQVRIASSGGFYTEVEVDEVIGTSDQIIIYTGRLSGLVVVNVDAVWEVDESDETNNYYIGTP